MTQPLIVTLDIDAGAKNWFDRLRTEYFPPDRLFVGAHITMFHALPGDCETDLRATLAAESARHARFPVSVRGTRFLGRGVAFTLDARPAEQIRAVLATMWAPRLSPQDRARWHPHITIQNKVAPQVARETEAILRGLHPPQGISATGLSLWRYENGPWSAAGAYPFRIAD